MKVVIKNIYYGHLDKYDIGFVHSVETQYQKNGHYGNILTKET
jgi:hypothetical protein